MREFGVLSIFEARVPLSLETRDRARASLDPHDHAVFADADLDDLDLAFLFDAELADYGFYNVGDEDLTPSTPVFKLELAVSSVGRFDAKLELDGLLHGGTAMELYELSCAAVVRFWALKRSDIPGEFYKETVAEGLCSELDGRLKQAFFAYATALDAQINFALTELLTLSDIGEALKRLRLEDKLNLLLEWTTGCRDLASDPLSSAVRNKFSKLVTRRNSIAHSLKAGPVKPAELDEAVFLILVLAMVLQAKSLDPCGADRAVRPEVQG